MQVTLDSGLPNPIRIITTDVQKITSEGGNLRIILAWRKSYADSGHFKAVSMGKTVSIVLEPWQVQQMVTQMRAASKAFCTGHESGGCFDHGKSHTPPASCLRCVLVAAAGLERQARGAAAAEPVDVERPGGGLVVALLLSLLMFWVVVCQWAGAESRAERLQAEMVRKERKR